MEGEGDGGSVSAYLAGGLVAARGRRSTKGHRHDSSRSVVASCGPPSRMDSRQGCNSGEELRAAMAVGGSAVCPPAGDVYELHARSFFKDGLKKALAPLFPLISPLLPRFRPQLVSEDVQRAYPSIGRWSCREAGKASSQQARRAPWPLHGEPSPRKAATGGCVATLTSARFFFAAKMCLLVSAAPRGACQRLRPSRAWRQVYFPWDSPGERPSFPTVPTASSRTLLACPTEASLQFRGPLRLGGLHPPPPLAADGAVSGCDVSSGSRARGGGSCRFASGRRGSPEAFWETEFLAHELKREVQKVDDAEKEQTALTGQQPKSVWQSEELLEEFHRTVGRKRRGFGMQRSPAAGDAGTAAASPDGTSASQVEATWREWVKRYEGPEGPSFNPPIPQSRQTRRSQRRCTTPGERAPR
ncbi:hypothetical protein cyc_05718 [Cyclospora cayetanensis]|uniref:Uncharacterized protein n=1 Tax=Cyclospora cayetanensis TaxID=88456 RepID=A0A1D3D2Z6_9EIME|nr:hypothetical protein cyc_05718 [Cyclospora cayetanensis]